MGFIVEYKEVIKDAGDIMSIWKDIFLPLGGVALGFGLSEGAAWLRKKREINKIGESFDFEIESLKEPLKKQIVALGELKTTIEKYESTSPALYIYKNIEFVKNLDRHLVSEYSEKKHGKESLKRTRKIFNTLIVIEAEMDRLNEFYDKFSDFLGNNYENYRAVVNQYMRTISDYDLELKKNKKTDPFIFALMQMFNDTILNASGTTDIMQFDDRLHKKIIHLNIQYFGHPLYKDSSENNQKALDTLMAIRIETDAFVNKLNNITKSLESSYDKLYKENEIQNL